MFSVEPEAMLGPLVSMTDVQCSFHV